MIFSSYYPNYVIFFYTCCIIILLRLQISTCFSSVYIISENGLRLADDYNAHREFESEIKKYTKNILVGYKAIV